MKSNLIPKNTYASFFIGPIMWVTVWRRNALIDIFWRNNPLNNGLYVNSGLYGKTRPGVNALLPSKHKATNQRWLNVDPRLRRGANIKPTLVQRQVLARLAYWRATTYKQTCRGRVKPHLNNPPIPSSASSSGRTQTSAGRCAPYASPKCSDDQSLPSWNYLPHRLPCNKHWRDVHISSDIYIFQTRIIYN